MVDTAQLVARVTTKGVTKATSELDKFADGAQNAETNSVNFGKAAKVAGGFVLKAATAYAAASAALTAMALKSANAEREWRTLSNIAGESVQEFKAAAFAVNQVGISSEKLADISKDTREKLGEFIATGGGGFKDFFEEVAPLVGVTAQELQKLSGTEILGRVKSAMDEANVSLEEQSFFLESIASDTTNLIPLLANESAELNRLAASYSAVNDKLELTVNQQKGLSDLAVSFDLMTVSSSNAATTISATLAPTLNEFFSSVTEAVPTATQAIVDFFNVFIAAENLSSIKAVNSEIKETNEQIERLRIKSEKDKNRGGILGVALGSTVDLVRAEDRLVRLNSRLKELNEEQKKIADAEIRASSMISGGDFESSSRLTKAQEDAEEASLERRKRLQREFEDSELESEQAYFTAREDALSSSLSTISTLMMSSNSELFRIGQAAALANAFINISEGISKAISFGPIVGPILAAGVAAAGGVQLAAIAGQSPPSARAQGGQFGAGQDLLVGEKGPELVRFGSGGRIASANETAGMGGKMPNVTIINQGPANMEIVTKSVTAEDVVFIARQVINRDIRNPNSGFNKGIDATRNAQRIR